MAVMKRYLVFGAIGIALGFLIFATHVSEVLEWLVMGGVVLVPLSYLMSLISKGKKMNTTAFLILIVGFAAFIGLFSWYLKNDRIRSNERMKKKIEQANIERQEKAVKDSVENMQKQNRIAKESEEWYKKEGDKAFGNFVFGMSKSCFNKELDIIKKETKGYIIIDGSDFYIDEKECAFIHDKLYKIRLVSKQQDHIEYEMTRDEQRDYIDFHKKWLLGIFKDKYGEAHDENGWHFLHKDIAVYYTCVNPLEDENREPHRWASIITISQPKLSYEAYEESRKAKAKEDSIKNKRDEEKRKKEENIRKKKESFADGI